MTAVIGPTVPDHPRSRGEHLDAIASKIAATGSSPLARGARNDSGVIRLSCRIIPARAGSTSVGEAPADTAHGSSPLARGALDRRARVALVARIIPARAGSTSSSARKSVLISDHPRSRGEHTGELAASIEASGSSPLARGAQGVQALGDPRGGIIPARAGSTSRLVRVSRSKADHPRSRGEHLDRVAGVHGWVGSSPLARGARSGEPDDAGGVRIIPARAGSTAA